MLIQFRISDLVMIYFVVYRVCGVQLLFWLPLRRIVMLYDVDAGRQMPGGDRSIG